MRFEGADGPFCRVAAVHVGWHELVGAVPGGRDGIAVGCAGFVVEDVSGHMETSRFEARHDVVVGWDAVVIVFGLEGLDEDGVGILVVGHHDILITASRPDWEAARVVSEEGAGSDFSEVDFVSRRCGQWRWRCVQRRQWCRLGFGGPDVLAGLGHVPLVDTVGVRAVFRCQLVGEAGP